MKKQNIPTNYMGSEKTSNKVREQIAERFGKEEAKKYDPTKNCRTFNNWIANGFRVKRGERALKSYIVISGVDEKGNELKRVKTINLFYRLQVEAIA